MILENRSKMGTSGVTKTANRAFRALGTPLPNIVPVVPFNVPWSCLVFRALHRSLIVP